MVLARQRTWPATRRCKDTIEVNNTSNNNRNDKKQEQIRNKIVEMRVRIMFCVSVLVERLVIAVQLVARHDDVPRLGRLQRARATDRG